MSKIDWERASEAHLRLVRWMKEKDIQPIPRRRDNPDHPLWRQFDERQEALRQIAHDQD